MSVNVFVYVGIYCVYNCTCVCNCIQCIAVSVGCVRVRMCVSTAVSATVIHWWRGGVVARKAEDENQQGGGDEGPPLGLGNADLPPGEEKEGTGDLRPLRSLLLEPHAPGPFLRPTPSRTCWPVLSDTYHSHAASVRRPHPQPSPWLPSWEAGKRGESKAAGLGRVSVLPAPHPGATSSPQLLRPNSASS